MTPWIRRTALGLCALLAVACSPIVRNHGYVPSDGELAAIQVGRSSRADVAAAVGRPTASGLLDASGWYYVQSRFQQRGYSAPREIDRQVVAITFDGADRVRNVSRFGLQDGRVVPLSRRVTDTGVVEIGLLRQIFSNVGNFDIGDFIGEE